MPMTWSSYIPKTVTNWLAPMSLELKPSKTRITHTLNQHNGLIGFDFLGFHIRQYKVGQTHSARSTGRHPKLLGFKTIIKPSKAALKRHQQTLHTVIKTIGQHPKPASSVNSIHSSKGGQLTTQRSAQKRPSAKWRTSCS
jgi:hypothetical protein